MNPKITLLQDGLFFVPNAPEKRDYVKPPDGAVEVPECDYEAYYEALEQAIKEGVKFSNQKDVTNALRHVLGATMKTIIIEQGKLYDIPEGYQVSIEGQCSNCEVNCGAESCKAHEYAVLEPLTKQEPEIEELQNGISPELDNFLTKSKELGEVIMNSAMINATPVIPENAWKRGGSCEQFELTGVHCDTICERCIRPESTPVIEQKEEASEFLKSKVTESGKYKILAQLPFALYPIIAEVMKEYAESKQLTNSQQKTPKDP